MEEWEKDLTWQIEGQHQNWVSLPMLTGKYSALAPSKGYKQLTIWQLVYWLLKPWWSSQPLSSSRSSSAIATPGAVATSTLELQSLVSYQPWLKYVHTYMHRYISTIILWNTWLQFSEIWTKVCIWPLYTSRKAFAKNSAGWWVPVCHLYIAT